MANIKLPFSLVRPSATEGVTDASEIDDSVYGKSQHQINAELYSKQPNLSGYVKKEDLEGYLQEEDLEDYAKLTDIPKPPTVDTTLSNTSTNPVENRAISREMAALKALAQSIIDNGLGDIADFALTFLEESAVENLTADAMSEKMIYIGMEPYEGEEEGSSSSAAYDNGYANVSDAIYDNGYVKVGNATYDNGFVTI